jgi:Zn-dependent protease with chaperone function
MITMRSPRRDARFYVSRRLLERLADDDAAAFIIAHELAHHRLGHIVAIPRSWLGVARGVLIWLEQRWTKTPGHERAADLLAIELCLDAGYDPERCIAALAHLEQVSLDYGDVDGVLGSEGGARRSHPAIRARIAAVRDHLAKARGVRIPLDVSLQRERQRRRKTALVAAGNAAAFVALLVLRRRP